MTTMMSSSASPFITANGPSSRLSAPPGVAQSRFAGSFSAPSYIPAELRPGLDLALSDLPIGRQSARERYRDVLQSPDTGDSNQSGHRPVSLQTRSLQARLPLRHTNETSQTSFNKKSAAGTSYTISEDCTDERTVLQRRLCALEVDAQSSRRGRPTNTRTIMIQAPDTSKPVLHSNLSVDSHGGHMRPNGIIPDSPADISIHVNSARPRTSSRPSTYYGHPASYPHKGDPFAGGLIRKSRRQMPLPPISPGSKPGPSYPSQQSLPPRRLTQYKYDDDEFEATDNDIDRDYESMIYTARRYDDLPRLTRGRSAMAMGRRPLYHGSSEGSVDDKYQIHQAEAHPDSMSGASHQSPLSRGTLEKVARPQRSRTNRDESTYFKEDASDSDSDIGSNGSVSLMARSPRRPFANLQVMDTIGRRPRSISNLLKDSADRSPSTLINNLPQRPGIPISRLGTTINWDSDSEDITRWYGGWGDERTTSPSKSEHLAERHRTGASGGYYGGYVPHKIKTAHEDVQYGRTVIPQSSYYTSDGYYATVSSSLPRS